MPPTTVHEETQAQATDKRSGTADTSIIMDDAPLFAGLDDFVLIQTEKKKTKHPKKAAPPQDEASTPQAPATPAAEPPPKRQPRARKAPQPADPDTLLLSVAEMCRLLRISRATLIRMDKAGKLPGRIKLGGSVRFHRETVEAWLKGLITSSAP